MNVWVNSGLFHHHWILTFQLLGVLLECVNCYQLQTTFCLHIFDFWWELTFSCLGLLPWWLVVKDPPAIPGDNYNVGDTVPNPGLEDPLEKCGCSIILAWNAIVKEHNDYRSGVTKRVSKTKQLNNNYLFINCISLMGIVYLLSLYLLEYRHLFYKFVSAIFHLILLI